jgi:hypothetical protein
MSCSDSDEAKIDRNLFLLHPKAVTLRSLSFLRSCNVMAFRFAFFINESGAGGGDMKQADLTSQIDGSNVSFTVPEEYQAGSLRVYYNGIRQVEGETFDEYNSTTFTTNFTPAVGDYVTVDYIAQAS